MAKFHPAFINDDQNDLKLQNAILDANHSPDAAAYLLVRIAEFLENGQPIPTRLALRVSNAFRKSGSQTAPELRIGILSRELGLMHGTKPSKESLIRVGEWVESVLCDLNEKGTEPISETTAVSLAAKEFGISDTTVRSYLKIYREAKDDT